MPPPASRSPMRTTISTPSPTRSDRRSFGGRGLEQLEPLGNLGRQTVDGPAFIIEAVPVIREGTTRAASVPDATAREWFTPRPRQQPSNTPANGLYPRKRQRIASRPA